MDIYLIISLAAVIEFVRREKVADKYGAFFLIFSLTLFIANRWGVFDWPISVNEALASALVLSVILIFGLLTGSQLTAYRKERRLSVQELALARFEMEQQEIGQTFFNDKDHELSSR